MNVSLSRKRVFAGIMKLRWGRTGVGWALNAMTGVFIRRPCENTGTQGEPHVITETEISVLCLQSKAFWQPPEARSKTLTDSPSEPSDRTNSTGSLILDF